MTENLSCICFDFQEIIFHFSGMRIFEKNKNGNEAKVNLQKMNSFFVKILENGNLT